MHVFKWPLTFGQHHVFMSLPGLFLLHRCLSLGFQPNHLFFLLLAAMPLLPPKSSSNSPGRISQSAFFKISCRSFPSGSTDHISVKFADFFKGRLCVWHLFLLQINH